jgi:hypothetical protein
MKRTVLEEIKRHNFILKYKNYINEQEMSDAPAPEGTDMVGGTPPPADAPPADAPPAPGGELPPPTENDVEEIDITDLVNLTKDLKQDVEKSKNANLTNTSKMDDVFTKLNDLEQKLQSMDRLMATIDELGTKIERIKEPTPQEKLEMRSLDSYPFNQNPKEFFTQKQKEMKLSGKNEYVLTKNDVDNYSKNQIMNSFNPDYNENRF